MLVALAAVGVFTGAQAVVVTVTSPATGTVWTGGAPTAQTVTWTAPDVTAVRVEVYYRDSESAPWTPLSFGRSLSGLPLGAYIPANTGSFTWFVPNTPTVEARVRIVALDSGRNPIGEGMSNLFTIGQQAGGRLHTTLRDFHQPGTQPFGAEPLLPVDGAVGSLNNCNGCHEVGAPTAGTLFEFKGTMMAQAARDPLFYAALAIAEQDAPSAGDLCIRCHSPGGWLEGHSQPTSGAQLDQSDRDAVSCNFCHRMVDPIYQLGISPVEDEPILAGLMPAHQPTGYSNGQYVLDPDRDMRRGPYPPVAGHAHLALESPFHHLSNLCGTCHDVSNPVFDRVGTSADYAAGPLNQAASLISSHGLMPIERTYSEWLNSAYPAGVANPEFGTVSECQDCHQPPDAINPNRTCLAGPLRANLPMHDFTGGNSWMPGVIKKLGEAGGPYATDGLDGGALDAAAVRASTMLGKAATLEVEVHAGTGGPEATVKVTNHTGHKLPTGYPEGRRMWLSVLAKDAASQIVAEWGAYNTATGVLTQNPGTVVYEANLGISPGLAVTLTPPVSSGPSFHFVLNDKVFKDNRIPPEGFTNATYDAFGGAPVDASGPQPRYANDQNWDASTYALPATAVRIEVRLKYQTASKEYIEFLRDENTTNTKGQFMYDKWAENGAFRLSCG